MGYSVHIGEAVVDAYEGDEFEQLTVGVEELFLPEAPALPNDVNPGKNIRWPSYGAWHDFTRAVGLHSLFYGGEPRSEASRGLMSAHPGCVSLTKEHHQQIVEALARYRQSHPDAVAGFQHTDYSTSPPTSRDTHYDALLGRLVWLEWWVGWAIVNCRRPAIYNS